MAFIRDRSVTLAAAIGVALLLLIPATGFAQDAPAEAVPTDEPAPAEVVPTDEPAAIEVPDGRLLFAEDFEGPLDDWDTSMVVTGDLDGALVYWARQDQSLILRRPLPMDEITIQFRARADTNGFQVYLMKTQSEHYGWSIGMDGNRHSMLIHDASGEALETAIGPAFTPEQWHTWRLVRRGNTLEAYRDGQLVIGSGAAHSYSGEGLLVFSTDGASIAIDSLRIYGAAEEPAEPPAAETDAPQPPAAEQPDEGAQPPAAEQPGDDEQPGEGDGDVQEGGAYEPIPLAEDSSIRRAVICLGFDDRSGLRGVQDVFPSGTEKVALYMEMVDARPNTEIQMTWRRDGNIIARQLLLVSGDKKNIGYLYAAGQEHLWDGHYAVDIRENGRDVGRVTFRVGDE